MTAAKRDALGRMIKYATEEACRQNEQLTARLLEEAHRNLGVKNMKASESRDSNHDDELGLGGNDNNE